MGKIRGTEPTSIYHNSNTVDDELKNNFFRHKHVSKHPSLDITFSNDSRWEKLRASD